jgi:hypothetical protein
MRKFHASTLGFDQGSALLFSDFSDNGEMWAGEGAREVRHAITFDEAFRTPPLVQVGIAMWDTDHRTNMRADISAEDVDRAGFTVVFRTWGDTRIARVRADWFALGELPDEDDWQL